MGKKVELLAPAGNYESFLGAIHAGADAVYIGGQKFGARAFADNFTQEEVCSAISYAHLFGRKVYLTLNTLVKENEMPEIYGYLLPFYEAGLDGIIVQDMGVLSYLRRQFPGLALHISTQMTLTGKYGAARAKKMGAVRIVPARELSLTEIKEIKKQENIEIEAFIHGSLCYCYSGQCLFSSMLGGRSGNRGKCAQPCRLPYQKDNLYPLSLKDLCTIEMIPELIEAGIDSFKIEGRMKKAEYAAGVTAVYRKYIDRYYESPSEKSEVEQEDLEKLKSLYIRTNLQEGYYRQHNGKNMVTLDKPGYRGSDERLLAEIRARYLEQKPTILLDGIFTLQKGKPMLLTVSKGDSCLTAVGDTAIPAEKRPVTKEDIRKQLLKTGGSEFTFGELQIEAEEGCFVPLKAINELRREALTQIKEVLIPGRRETVSELSVLPTEAENATPEGQKKCRLSAEVTSLEQWQTACSCNPLERVYVPADLLSEQHETILEAVRKRKQQNPSFQMFAALPYILRKRSYPKLQQYEELLFREETDGVLVRNLEEAEWLSEISFTKKRIADANLYTWNKEAAAVLSGWDYETTLPFELNERELRQVGMSGKEMIVYGRIPMMVSAGCIQKTLSDCTKETGFTYLKDRFQKKFPVYHQCEHCYNVIYNCVPLSLLQFMTQIREQETAGCRLVFTNEDSNDMRAVLEAFSKKRESLHGEYTKGHYKRGVE